MNRAQKPHQTCPGPHLSIPPPGLWTDYTLQENTDHPYNDIGSRFSSTSGSSCAATCAATPGCKAAAYGRAPITDPDRQGFCFLKDAIGDLAEQAYGDGMDTYLMPPAGKCPAGTVKSNNACVAGETCCWAAFGRGCWCLCMWPLAGRMERHG